MDLHMLLRIGFIITYVTALPFSETKRKELSTALSPDNNEHVLNQLLERVEHLESRDKVQQNEIDSLQEELHVEKQRTTVLEKIIRKLRTGEQTRKQKYAPSSATETKSSSGEISEPHSDVALIVTKQSRTTNRIRRAENEMKVAFFSTLTNHLVHAGVKQNIAFDNVVTNIGNAYNNHAGVFIAPVQGTYVFSVTLMALSTHTTHYMFSKNGSLVSNIYVRGLESPYATSSQTVVLDLKQGDDISIQNVDADESLHGGSYSTFAGFLLQQEYSSPNVVGK